MLYFSGGVLISGGLYALNYSSNVLKEGAIGYDVTMEMKRKVPSIKKEMRNAIEGEQNLRRQDKLVEDGNKVASEHTRQLANQGNDVRVHDDKLAAQEAEIIELKKDNESLNTQVQSQDAKLQTQDTKLQTLEAQNGEQSVRLQAQDIKLQTQDTKLQELEKNLGLLMVKLAQREPQSMPLAG